MDLGLSGRTGLLTGASAGIGRAIARALGAEGVRLAITARRRDRLDALAAEIEKAGVPRPFRLDASEAQWEEALTLTSPAR